MKNKYIPPLAEIVLLDLETAVLGFSAGSEIIVPMYNDPFYELYDEDY